MLEVQNLMVFFENALAINDLSIDVKEGEVVGIIGSNSAGKTTLMNSLSGLIIDMRIKEKRRGGERITVYGKILYNGQDITETRPDERVKMGIVLCRERHPIFPESSVLENLKIAGYLKKRIEIIESIEYVFELFPALIQLKARKAGFLSGGEQQMVAMARALMARPRLLIMDEPSMGLSPLLVDQQFELIQKVNQQGTTIFMVEQNANMALSIADRGYVLQTGSIVLSDTAENLLCNEMMQEAYLGGADVCEVP